MKIAFFRFYEELNDFLPAVRRKTTFSWTFSGTPSVKFAIEALGVPHTEVDLILVNGKSVDFSCKIQTDDSVSVYPVFESLDISPVTRLRERPLRHPKFIADVHLGKLARYLRLCGFNTLFRNDFHDREIIEIALSEKRTILTRDRELLKHKNVTRAYWLRTEDPREQVREVLSRLDLKKRISPFTLCIECNGTILTVAKDLIAEKLLPKTSQYFQEFWKCTNCGRIFWKGSHYERMRRFVEGVINEK